MMCDADAVPHRKPKVRAASPLEVFNIPLFEVPPTLDVRASAAFLESHLVCAVSVPAEDGFDARRLFERILSHDDVWGWCLQHPLVIVHDEASYERAQWLADVLCQVVAVRADLTGFEGADRAESLLRRLGFQCREIFLLRGQDFAYAFASCCTGGDTFAAAPFFDRLGPLPRCALLHPRIFIAGSNVRLTEDMLQTLGVTHMVVTADAWDVIDSSSGGGGGQRGRDPDVSGVCYLKCDIPPRQEDKQVATVLEGAARFLQGSAAQGGVSLICLDAESRSAAVLCGFLVASRGLSVDASWLVFQEAGIKAAEPGDWWSALQLLPALSRKRSLEDGQR